MNLTYLNLNAKVLPNKELMPQTTSTPGYPTLKEEKYFSIVKTAARPIQYDKARPSLPRDSALSSSASGSSQALARQGMLLLNCKM